MNPWLFLGRAVLFMAGSAAVLILAGLLPVPRQSPLQELVIGSAASVGTLLLTLLFARWDGIRLSDIGVMPTKSSLSRFFIGALLGLLLIAIHSLISAASGHMAWKRVGGANFLHALPMLIGYVLLAVREELAFHGYPLRRVETYFGVLAAQVIISVTFALEHIAGGWSYGQAIWGAAMGSLLFGMASIATRGLAVPIGMHAAWNFGDWARGNRSTLGFWRPEVERGFEPTVASTGMYSYIALMALAILCFWLLHRARSEVEVSIPIR